LLALASISPYFLTDRYLLPWLPFALIAVLGVIQPVRPSLPLATVLLAASVVLNVALMIDYSQRAALRWEIARHLVESGIPANDIAASWEWQWWWGYWQVYQVGDGLPGAAEPDPDAQDTASSLRMVERNSDRRRDVDRPYRISAVPEPGYAVEQAYSYWSPLGWQARPLYVLRAPSAHSHGTLTPEAGWASIAAVWSWHLTWPQSLRPGAS